MIYQINMDKNKTEEFLLIIESLRKLGVVQSFKSTENLVTPSKTPVSTSRLLEVLDRAEKEIIEGKTVPSEQVHQMLQNWK